LKIFCMQHFMEDIEDEEKEEFNNLANNIILEKK
jgi:hypothetical protein